MGGTGEESRADENVRLVQEMLAEWRRRELETMLGYLSDDVEWRPTALTAREEVYVGHDGVRRWTEQFDPVTRDPDIRISETRAAGDRVLVLGTVVETSYGRPTVATPAAWVFELEGGKITRGQGFTDWQRAISASGISESEAGSLRERSRTPGSSRSTGEQ